MGKIKILNNNKLFKTNAVMDVMEFMSCCFYEMNDTKLILFLQGIPIPCAVNQLAETFKIEYKFV